MDERWSQNNIKYPEMRTWNFFPWLCFINLIYFQVCTNLIYARLIWGQTSAEYSFSFAKLNLSIFSPVNPKLNTNQPENASNPPPMLLGWRDGG